MRRYAVNGLRTLALALLLAASPAGAETMRYYLGGVGNGTLVGNLPESFIGGVAFDNDVDWIVPLTVADLGTTFELNSSTAASYNITMQEITDAVWWGNINPPSGIWLQPFLKTNEGNRIMGDLGISDFGQIFQNIDTFEVLSVEFQPRLNANSTVAVAAWMTVVLPEPSATALLLVGLCGVFVHRQKTPHLARR